MRRVVVVVFEEEVGRLGDGGRGYESNAIAKVDLVDKDLMV